MKRDRTVPSKQWSCSELKEGQSHLLAVKNEPEDDLAAKIQEPTLMLHTGNLLELYA